MASTGAAASQAESDGVECSAARLSYNTPRRFRQNARLETSGCSAGEWDSCARSSASLVLVLSSLHPASDSGNRSAFRTTDARLPLGVRRFGPPQSFSDEGVATLIPNSNGNSSNRGDSRSYRKSGNRAAFIKLARRQDVTLPAARNVPLTPGQRSGFG